MKILWITNILFPAVCEAMGLKAPVTGGWMYSSAKALLKADPSIQLAVATVYNGDTLEKKVIDNIAYYMIPLKGSNIDYHKELESFWCKVNEDIQPDLAHLHGTELAHGLAFLNACPQVKSVVSIQGLVSVIARYYHAGIAKRKILKNITFREIVRFDNLFQQKTTFYKRGLVEKEIIRKSNHVIGRTSWDKAHCLAINPNIQYHFCNETLRSEFYKHTWSYDNCQKHTLFLSQAGYPIKGLHKVIEALPFILSKYPDTKVYVAGNDITASKNWRQQIRCSGYGKYIKSLLHKLNVEDKICFTGLLNEEQICERYLKSNLFVCPSSIENSPNSLGEAQLLGVPCLASYVGGVPDMMKGAEENMYRFEEVEMLAMKVCEIFKLEDKVDIEELKLEALRRHDQKENARQLSAIYNKIFK